MDNIRVQRTDVNVKFLKEVTEEEATQLLNFLPKTEVIRAWKIANGKSKPKKRIEKIEGE